jgi:AraC-like DNA-binding protein
VLHLAHQARVQQVAGRSETFELFRRAVEDGFTRSRRVQDYGAQLGYSVRTLTRATHRAAGIGAKELIDRRVILEAERLLAHTDLTSAQVSDQLGFDSPTNFGKYFQQRTGRTPGAFRATHRTLR